MGLSCSKEDDVPLINTEVKTNAENNHKNDNESKIRFCYSRLMAMGLSHKDSLELSYYFNGDLSKVLSYLNDNYNDCKVNYLNDNVECNAEITQCESVKHIINILKLCENIDDTCDIEGPC
eukprot:242007_1